MIWWSIDAARGSKYIDTVVLSTEDHEISQIAKSLGCTVIHRPNDLATDDAMNEDVLRHTLSLIEADLVILLQPTSPLRISEDIDKCLEMADGDDGCISYRLDGKKNGAVYVATAEWLNKGNYFDKPFKSYYLMPYERSLDIDTEDQLS